MHGDGALFPKQMLRRSAGVRQASTTSRISRLAISALPSSACLLTKAQPGNHPQRLEFARTIWNRSGQRFPRPPAQPHACPKICAPVREGAFHSPSPSDLRPVLSIKRFSGPGLPRDGWLTFSVLWRRHRVLNPGTARQPGRPQQALNETRGLPERQTKQNLQGQAGLDRCIAEIMLTRSLARWRRRPGHLRIKPNRQRSALLQRARQRARTSGVSMARCTMASSWSCTS